MEKYIELHGKAKAITYKDVDKIKILFHELNAGNMVLTISRQSILYHTLKLHKYYNLFVELRGITKMLNGKVQTNNVLIVKKVVED